AYVWSALGLYPEIPGRAELVTGSPLFTSATISTPAGKKIVIDAPNNADNTPYVTDLKVNGQEYNKPWLPESLVRDGGTLEFTMSERPDISWGAAPSVAPPSFREGEVPQRVFADPGRQAIPAGGTGVLKIGVQDFTGNGSTINWTAKTPSGITANPTNGKVVASGGQTNDQAVTISVANNTPNGTYQIPIEFTDGSGNELPSITVNVLVAPPGSLLAAFDNVGISPDDNPGIANFDGVGFSYSADALAAAGVKPGGTVTVDGITHTWANPGVGQPDNVVAHGQVIDMSGAPSSATKLALLGSAANGNASGTLTITYSDGSTQAASIGFSDWTLGGGGSPIAYDNRIAATTPYRNSAGGPQQVNTYVFATAPIALESGKQLKSVTLPSVVQGGTLQVFAISAG
ncbi:MAG: glycoside hydrolase family 92 protein, partial [Sciscionella sp.]|nr:glycoside hydrolase family 92 protein [Sciscionella sp.]